MKTQMQSELQQTTNREVEEQTAGQAVLTRAGFPIGQQGQSGGDSDRPAPPAGGATLRGVSAGKVAPSTGKAPSVVAKPNATSK